MDDQGKRNDGAVIDTGDENNGERVDHGNNGENEDGKIEGEIDNEEIQNENIGDDEIHRQQENIVGDEIHRQQENIEDVNDGLQFFHGDHPNGGEDIQPLIAMDELDHHPSGNRPGCCSCGFVIFHSIMIFLLILIALLIIVYISIPGSSMSTIAHHSTIIVLPQPGFLNWPGLVRRLHIKTDGPCTGELYYIPCSEIVVNYTENYVPLDLDFIYCMGNSSFTFTQVRPEAAEGYVTDNVYWFSHSFDYDAHINCTNLPPHFKCLHFDGMNNSDSQIKIQKTMPLDLPSYSGNYYFIRTSFYSIRYTVDRYSIYYDSKYKDLYFNGTIYKGKSARLNMQEKSFSPWTMGSNNKGCLLLNTTKHDCYESSSPFQNVIVNAEKRYDVLLWPVLVFIVVLAIQFFVGLRQWFIYHEKKRDFNNSLLQDIAS